MVKSLIHVLGLFRLCKNASRSSSPRSSSERVCSVNHYPSRRRLWKPHTSVFLMRSDHVDEAAREKPRPAVPLECAFEPAVLPLLVHKHYVALFQLQLGLALRGVRHHHTVPLANDWPSIMLHRKKRGAWLPWWWCNGHGVLLAAIPGTPMY